LRSAPIHKNDKEGSGGKKFYEGWEVDGIDVFILTFSSATGRAVRLHIGGTAPVTTFEPIDSLEFNPLANDVLAVGKIFSATSSLNAAVFVKSTINPRRTRQENE
jgi:hypothetical protein